MTIEELKKAHYERWMRHGIEEEVSHLYEIIEGLIERLAITESRVQDLESSAREVQEAKNER